MTRRKWLGCTLLCTALGFALSLPSATPAQYKDGEPLKLGMVDAFFTDLPKAVVDLVTAPFGQLMKETTGLDGKLCSGDNCFGVAEKLVKNELQLGVFHGHELAWVQKKHPSLRPLMVVTNNQHDVSAYVIVRHDNPAKSIADLRGKNIDLPLGTKEHCRVFLGKHCTDNAQKNWRGFFGSIAKSDSPNQALDNLCKGKINAVLIDSIGLAFYKDVKGPVFTKNLRILSKSESFPLAVIVYNQGSLKESTLKQFTDGLLKATDNAVGRDLMQMWGIEGFQMVPADYQQSLNQSLKLYPTP